jgi:acetyl-CoA synthetase
MKTYAVSEAKKKNSIISEEDFNAEYQESINNPESFWQKKAKETLDWFGSRRSSLVQKRKIECLF